jgi:uncharacterized phage-associated protein
MKHPAFNETKATEAVAYLLKKVASRQMYLIHVLKMLYIADREALQSWGRPITWDRYISMDNGPVLSETYNLMTGAAQGNGIWERHISDRLGHKIGLEEDLPPGGLSKVELALLDSVFERFGTMDRWALCEFTHTFPEWKNPHGSTRRIRVRDILRAANKTPEEIEEICSGLEMVAEAESLLG